MIREFISITGAAIAIDMTRVEAVLEHDEDSLRSIIVTSSDTYHIQLEYAEVVKVWKGIK